MIETFTSNIKDLHTSNIVLNAMTTNELCDFIDNLRSGFDTKNKFLEKCLKKNNYFIIALAYTGNRGQYLAIEKLEKSIKDYELRAETAPLNTNDEATLKTIKERLQEKQENSEKLKQKASLLYDIYLDSDFNTLKDNEEFISTFGNFIDGKPDFDDPTLPNYIVTSKNNSVIMTESVFNSFSIDSGSGDTDWRLISVFDNKTQKNLLAKEYSIDDIFKKKIPFFEGVPNFVSCLI